MRTVRKHIGAILFAALSGVCTLSAQERIVYIDGAKYRIHVVAKGETLYSLSKRYEVSIDEIMATNPALADGLKTDQMIKIPYNDGDERSEKRPKKQFDIHTVKKGETIYSISRRYSISVDTLIADNDNLDPSHVAVGRKLYIRKSEIGQTGAEEAKEELVKRSEAMSNVADGDFSYHVVHSGETPSNIAERFGTTEQALLEINGMANPSEMKEGLIIKVPKPNVLQAVETDEVQTDEACAPVSFRRLSADETAKISLLLPLSVNDKPSQNYVDFYQGFMIGLDAVRMGGHSVDLRLFNTGHDYDRINSLVANGSLDGSDLIVGPVYEDELFPVAKYAETNSIPVVSPLANISGTQSNAVFQMSPNHVSKYDKVRNLFDGTRRIVLISSDNTDTEFEAEILQIIGNTPYVRHKYVYEHPSIVERRIKSGSSEYSPSDLSPLLQDERESVFVILSDNETDTDRILAALASAKISLTARSRSVTPFSVLGNTKWNRYRNIDRSIFFANNVIMLSTYHAGRDNAQIREFDSRYASEFGAVPSLYSYRGYDAAVIFAESLYGAIETGLSGRRFIPLQTPYGFDADGDGSIRTNTEWVRVNYNNDFTTTIE